MEFEQIMVVAATLIGAVTTVFAPDLRAMAIRHFGRQDDDNAEAPPTGKALRRRKRPWLAAFLIVLAGALILVAARSLTRSQSPPEPQSSTTMSGTEPPLNQMSSREPPSEKQPVEPAPVPRSFDWGQYQGNMPIWFRTARNNPRSVYVDAASIRSPTPTTRRFWVVFVPDPKRQREAAEFGISYIKAVQTVDCSRGTVTIGRSELYARDGTHIVTHSEAEMAAEPEMREHEAIPGSNDQAVLRFVCEGPDENSAEVLRGGNMAEYLAANPS